MGKYFRRMTIPSLRDFMGKKTARFSVRGAEFGWSGKRGGRTVEFTFWDESDLIGVLQISEAAVKWRRAHSRGPWDYDIPVDELDGLFAAYEEE